MDGMQKFVRLVVMIKVGPDDDEKERCRVKDMNTWVNLDDVTRIVQIGEHLYRLHLREPVGGADEVVSRLEPFTEERGTWWDEPDYGDVVVARKRNA